MRHGRAALPFLAAFVLSFGPVASNAQPGTPQFLDQGSNWTSATRDVYYNLDQGSQLIPLAWLEALRQKDGTPFLDGALARYGLLPNEGGPAPQRLPIGFTVAASKQGPMVGMTCAACHVRQIEADGQTFRIDGGPSFIDFQALTVDLDQAVLDALKDDASFAAFAEAVLGQAPARSAVDMLHDEVAYWSVRYHAFVSGSIDRHRAWGPTRLDAMQLIYNRVVGLDIGPPPTYLIEKNIKPGTAPVRNPFLWDAPSQDRTQWGGFSKNGNDIYALTRNLGQTYGVFGTLSPHALPAGAAAPVNRDYLGENSANIPNLFAAETLIRRLGPPAWPWRVDTALAKEGEAIFNRGEGDGGCATCHAKVDGVPRPPNMQTWRTLRKDVGTDMAAWDHTLLRTAETGSLEGASVPGYFPPLKKTDSALSLLEVVVLGSIFQYQAAHQAPKQTTQAANAAAGTKTDDPKAAPAEVAPTGESDDFAAHVFEARVLRGIWAAAPYLHNGSVPTLADLLKPAADRPRSFAIGPAYDPVAVGLASKQAPSAYTLRTTGCDDIMSGDSNCGHEYGTHLKPAEKKALLEYLKTL